MKFFLWVIIIILFLIVLLAWSPWLTEQAVDNAADRWMQSQCPKGTMDCSAIVGVENIHRAWFGVKADVIIGSWMIRNTSSVPVFISPFFTVGRQKFNNNK